MSIGAYPAGATTQIYFTTWNDFTGRGTVNVTTLGSVGSIQLADTTGLQAMSVSVDAKAARLYWGGTDGSDGSSYIRRANVDGSGDAEIWESDTVGNDSLYSLTWDADEESLYWSTVTNSSARVSKGTISGSSVTETSFHTATWAFTVNTANSVVYGAQSGTTNQAISQKRTSNIAIAPIADPPSSATSTFSSAKAGQARISSLIANPEGSALYWTSCMRFLDWSTTRTCAGDIYSRATTAADGDASTGPINGGTTITGLTSIAMDSAGCLYYGTYDSDSTSSLTYEGRVERLDTGAGCPALTPYSGTNSSVSSLWIVESPSAMTPPTVTGTAETGNALTCADATWTGDAIGARLSRQPTTARSYVWVKDGSVIGGEASPTYTPTAAGSYACRITAANVAGSTTATSPSRSVTTAAAPSTDTGTSPGTAATPSGGGSTANVPGAVKATAGLLRAIVTWTAPTDTGGGIAGYTATASPGGRTCTTTGALTCTVTGLLNTKAYTFTVTARSAGGTSAASAKTTSVRPYEKLGMPRPVASGSAIRSGVATTGPATVTQIATNAKGATVCRASARPKRKGTSALTCTLNQATRTALRKKPQTVTVLTVVLTRQGASFGATHRVRLPKTS